MRKSFDDNLKKTLNSLVQESVQFALARYPVVSEYVQQHAQEMSEDVMRQHIDLYVNNYSLDVDETGERAIAKLLEVYQQVHHSEQGGLQPRIVR